MEPGLSCFLSTDNPVLPVVLFRYHSINDMQTDEKASEEPCG
jgi:hypothetical protein